MNRNAALLTLAIGLGLLGAVAPPAQARKDKSRVLTFEAAGTAYPLSEWSGGLEGTLFLDSTVVHEGHYSGRIERVVGSPSDFSAFTLGVPIDFRGDTLELRGWLRYENVTGYVGLWQRQDAASGPLEFDNMAARQLKGTADWAEYRIALPLAPKSQRVALGALLVGQGRLWVDDLRLYVDGRPLAEVPEAVRESTALDRDHEFDAGSKVEIARLTAQQVDNLVLLGKVWGFLKYHHPAIVAGRRHWDYELFRVLPQVLAAPDHRAGQKTLAAWVASLGEPPPCSPCVEVPKGLAVPPPLGWLADRRRLGDQLSARLATIYARRPDVAEQFYMTRAKGAGNPEFDNEAAYRSLQAPDAGYRLLALFRFWNMVEYWFPNRDVIGEDWDGVLREFVPRLVAAGTREEYEPVMMALVARAQDTHANLWSSLDIQPPKGSAQVPVRLRFIGEGAVVTAYAHATLGPATGLRIGDVVRTIDGVPVDTLIARWRPMYAASNEAARLRDMAVTLTRGEPGPVRLGVARDGAPLELAATRVALDSLDQAGGRTHDLPGPAFRRLSDDVAYLKLSSARAADAGDYVRDAAGARCLIIDIRNYPSSFTVFTLGSHLVDSVTDFVRWTFCDARNPGAFTWSDPTRLTPQAPRFEGGVAILVDEVTQSSAEYHALAFRARPGAVVVGSTTAGADGNVSAIPLPGGLHTMFSGIGVFYPDRRPTQRVGIVPDLVVRPTVAGIRAGRDEVLEAAVQRVLGRPMSQAERDATNDGARR